MWRVINKEMSLRDCSIYCYAPEEDPYDGEDGAIWSYNYFFFNKARKRVCYLYLRGMSLVGRSPGGRNTASRKAAVSRSLGGDSGGARKRARYWLGDRADDEDLSGSWDDEDEETDVIAEDNDDEVDVDGYVLDDGDEMETAAEADEQDEGSLYPPNNAVRGISEEIAESMDV